jgi:2'-5' RNA ligase
MPRLFVALKPPAEVARRLAAMRADVAGARWVPEDDLHVTLARLNESDVAAVRSWTSTRISPLSFTAREVLLFESRPAGGGYAEVSRWALG